MSTPLNPPIAFRIVRPYASVEEFLAGDGWLIHRTGMVLVGAHTRPIGLIIRFEVALGDRSPLFRGEGKVVAFRTEEEDGKAAGLEIRFTRLDARGKAMIDQFLQMREQEGPSSVPDLIAPSLPILSLPPPAPSDTAPLSLPPSPPVPSLSLLSQPPIPSDIAQPLPPDLARSSNHDERTQRLEVLRQRKRQAISPPAERAQLLIRLQARRKGNFG